MESMAIGQGMAEIPDEALAAASCSGDREAFSLLVERHRELAFACALAYMRDRDEAEDVAQEGVLAFGRSSVPADEAPRWLSVAAAHTALNHLRSGRRRAAREEAAPTDHVTPDIADDVVVREERRRVRAALAKLPRRQAVALVLRHSGLSYADVAAALDLSPGSVGTTVRRAESALREELSTHALAD